MHRVRLEILFWGLPTCHSTVVQAAGPTEIGGSLDRCHSAEGSTEHSVHISAPRTPLLSCKLATLLHFLRVCQVRPA